MTRKAKDSSAPRPSKAQHAQPDAPPFGEAPSSVTDIKGKGKEVIPPPSTTRRNPAGVQLLSPSLHQQLFPGKRLPEPPSQLVQLSREHLQANGLNAADAARLEEINFDMPPLRGSNIRDHFYAVGKQEAEPYLSMAHEFAEAELPPMPDSWATEWPGWTKYHSDGRVEAVKDLGEETIVSFDVEVLYKLSPYPVIATAATPSAWYSWLCPTIFEKRPKEPLQPRPAWDKTIDDRLPHSLIPMFSSDKAGIVVGHNVGYDRARIKDEYTLTSTATRFLDTLSLHVATRGITSVQRPAWIKHRKDKRQRAAEEKGIKEATMELLRDLHPEYAEILDAMEAEPMEEDIVEEDSEGSGPKWEDVTSVNSLKDVAALHCGYSVDKTVRERFGDDEIKHASQLLRELDDLIQYCADDVKVTHDVYKKVFPLFVDSCPHPASFSGALSMGSAILPVDQQWNEYIRNAEETYRKMEANVAKSLRSLAEKLRLEGPRENDPWTAQLDWSEKKARWPDSGPGAPEAAVEAVKEASAIVDPAKTPDVSVVQDELASSPSPTTSVQTADRSTGRTTDWADRFLRDDLEVTRHFENRDIPLLLRMTFNGHPVFHIHGQGWCFRVPTTEAGAYTEAHGEHVSFTPVDAVPAEWSDNYRFFSLSPLGKPRKMKLTGPGIKPLIKLGLDSPYSDLMAAAERGDLNAILRTVPDLVKKLQDSPRDDPHAVQLSMLGDPTGEQ